MARFKKNRRGVSSVIICVYLALIMLVLGVSLFSAIEISTNSSIAQLRLNQERSQEAVLVKVGGLSVVNDKIDTITVNNTGSIMEKISGIYIGSIFIKDPSIYISPQESKAISISDKSISYSSNEYNSLLITTERGTAFSSVIADLDPKSSPGAEQSTVYGPIRLIFEQFYYTPFINEFTLSDLISSTWKEAWAVPPATDLIWRIRIQNVAEENIQINDKSSLTLISNTGGDMYVYYVDTSCSDLTIKPKDYATIYFAWGSPDADKPTNQIPKPPNPRAFITFLVLEGQVGNIPLGQTIPFEAVLVSK